MKRAAGMQKRKGTNEASRREAQFGGGGNSKTVIAIKGQRGTPLAVTLPGGALR